MDMFKIAIGMTMVLACVQTWYFFTHCWSVPALQMSGGCALLLYNSK